MAVPSNDMRDFEFANEFGLRIEPILDPDEADDDTRARVVKGEECWEEDGIFINSSSSFSGLDINGLRKQEGIRKTIDWLEEKGLGKEMVNYKMRGWETSRPI